MKLFQKRGTTTKTRDYFKEFALFRDETICDSPKNVTIWQWPKKVNNLRPH
jgi:hypothetical protein